MPRAANLIGNVYGHLRVMQRRGSRHGHALWRCLCECGGTKDVTASDLKGGKVSSCGCIGRGRTTHGQTGHPLYKIWRGMIRRCHSPQATNYRWYGGRGVQVCSRWRMSFDAFVEDMGERPGPEYTIDRIDFDGDYEPDNCRWLTMSEQNKNKPKRDTGRRWNDSKKRWERV